MLGSRKAQRFLRARKARANLSHYPKRAWAQCKLPRTARYPKSRALLELKLNLYRICRLVIRKRNGSFKFLPSGFERVSFWFFLFKIGKKAAELSNFVQVRQNLAFYWRFCEITAIKFFTFAPPIKVSAAKKLTSVTFRSPRKHLKHFWSYKLINLLPIRFVGLASTREMIRAFQLIFRPKKERKSEVSFNGKWASIGVSCIHQCKALASVTIEITSNRRWRLVSAPWVS